MKTFRRAPLAAASFALIMQMVSPAAHAFPFFQNFGYGLLNRSAQDGPRRPAEDERAGKAEKKQESAKAGGEEERASKTPPPKAEQARDERWQ